MADIGRGPFDRGSAGLLLSVIAVAGFPISGAYDDFRSWRETMRRGVPIASRIPSANPTATGFIPSVITIRNTSLR